MDIGSILLLAALLLIVAAFLTRPLTGYRIHQISSDEQDRSRLLAERERVLDSLAELDLDNAMGKIPEKLYAPQRDQLLKQGVDVLQKLDEKQIHVADAQEPSARPKTQHRKATSATEDRIEALIAARRLVVVSKEPDKLITKKTPLKAGFCPKCGKPTQSNDVFCANCGARL